MYERNSPEVVSVSELFFHWVHLVRRIPRLLLGMEELGVIICSHQILTAVSYLRIIYLGQYFEPKLIQNNKGSV
jgi:hypothetical protein